MQKGGQRGSDKNTHCIVWPEGTDKSWCKLTGCQFGKTTWYGIWKKGRKKILGITTGLVNSLGDVTTTLPVSAHSLRATQGLVGPDGTTLLVAAPRFCTGAGYHHVHLADDLAQLDHSEAVHAAWKTRTQKHTKTHTGALVPKCFWKTSHDQNTRKKICLLVARRWTVPAGDSPGLQGADGVNLCDAHNGTESLESGAAAFPHLHARRTEQHRACKHSYTTRAQRFCRHLLFFIK